MQFVSRQVLQKLASSKFLENDSSSDGFSFQSFIEEYEKTLNSFSGKNRSSNQDNILMKTYDSLKRNYLKDNCPPIRFCGEGSSRAAFACTGGRCLKVAKNKKGIAQNKQEVKNLLNGKNDNSQYICFARLHDYDKNWSSLLTECCSKADDRDFDSIYGSPNGLQAIYEILDEVVENEADLKKTRDVLERRYGIMKDSSWRFKDANITEFELSALYWKMKCLDEIEKSGEARWKVLGDLVSFYKSAGSRSLNIGDLQNIENWGMAVRDGCVVPVVVDAGLSEDVYLDYYA